MLKRATDDGYRDASIYIRGNMREESSHDKRNHSIKCAHSVRISACVQIGRHVDRAARFLRV